MAAFSFFEDFADEIAPTQDTLIEFFLLTSPADGQHLGPASLTPDESAAGQFLDVTLGDSLSQKTTIFMKCLPANAAELGQNMLSVHPAKVGFADDGAMAAPRIAI